MKTYLVTGGAGFIGSNFVLLERTGGGSRIVNLDLLTYAGNLMNLESVLEDPDHIFIKGDIGDRNLVRDILVKHSPRAVINFAAESHVDRSIDAPGDFMKTNVMGTFHLLEEIRHYWERLSEEGKGDFRFLHVSTDEVYGSLGAEDPAFNENTPYSPNSPYSASKAASDHLVRAYHHTYGLPTLVTNCSNNYGPRQFPEKLLPLIILNALDGKKLPIYGDGMNVRDWLYVNDHCEAIRVVLEKGDAGETYNIGGRCEKSNLEIVETVCGTLDDMAPASPFRHYDRLISFVKDRPGHDRRYAIDCSKIEQKLGWAPKESLLSGLRKTIRWYLENSQWVDSVRSGLYKEWIKKHYGN